MKKSKKLKQKKIGTLWFWPHIPKPKPKEIGYKDI